MRWGAKVCVRVRGLPSTLPWMWEPWPRAGPLSAAEVAKRNPEPRGASPLRTSAHSAPPAGTAQVASTPPDCLVGEIS